jgi:tetratricopeptide (TPR) repeat protein
MSHALALDRNLAHAHHAIGFGKIFSGHTEETEAHINDALRLSPRDTMAYVWITFVGLAKLHLGNCEQAVASFRQAVEANRNYPIAYLMLAVALAKLGRLDEARSAVRAGLTFNPDFSISRARSAWTAMSDDPTFLTLLDIIFDGLRKAGVPE